MTSSLNCDHACPVVDVLPIWLGVKKDVSLCKMPVSGRRALDGVCPHIAKVIKPWCADGLFWGNRNNCISICHHFSPLRWHRDLEVSLTEKVPSLLWRHNGAMASQITSLTIVYSNVHSGADQRKHQSSASLAFVRGIHRWPVNSPHKGPVTRKMFPFDDVIMIYSILSEPWLQTCWRLKELYWQSSPRIVRHQHQKG